MQHVQFTTVFESFETSTMTTGDDTMADQVFIFIRDEQRKGGFVRVDAFNEFGKQIASFFKETPAVAVISFLDSL